MEADPTPVSKLVDTMLDDKIRDTLAEELRAAVMTNAAAIALATFDEMAMAEVLEIAQARGTDCPDSA